MAVTVGTGVGQSHLLEIVEMEMHSRIGQVGQRVPVVVIFGQRVLSEGEGLEVVAVVRLGVLVWALVGHVTDEED